MRAIIWADEADHLCAHGDYDKAIRFYDRPLNPPPVTHNYGTAEFWLFVVLAYYREAL